jgi:branched-chain amino acid transport system substrate-binding protein
MKKITLFGIVLVVLLVALLMGANYEVGAQPAPLKPYKIGGGFDLSGFMTSIGVPMKNGAVVAIDKINAEGTIHGRALELIAYESASDITRAVTNVRKLIYEDKVVALVGLPMTGQVLASAESITTGQTPLIAGCAGADIWRPAKKWIFSTAQGNDNYPYRACDYLKRKGFTKIALEYIDNSYGESGMKQIVEIAPKYGLTIVAIEKHKATDLDMAVQITKLRAARPDAIMLESYQRDAAVFMKNIKTLGITIPILGLAATAGTDIINIGGSSVEGFEAVATRPIVASQLPDTDPSKAVLLKFIKAYENKFGRFDYYATNLYDGIHLTANALQKCDARLDPYTDEGLKSIRAQIRDTIENTKDFLGGNGKYNYSPDKHCGQALDWAVVIKIVNGNWKLLN